MLLPNFIMSREVRTHAITPTNHHAVIVDSGQLSPEMPRYDQVRLELALKVFRDSESYRKQKGLEAKNLEALLTSTQYTLRSGVKAANTARTILWDAKDANEDDEEDNYEPESRKKRQAPGLATKPSVQKRKAPDETKNGRQNKKNRRTYQWGRKNGQQSVVKVKLTSDAGKEEFRRKVASLPELPAIEKEPCEFTKCWDENNKASLIARAGDSVVDRSSFSSGRKSLLSPDHNDAFGRPSESDHLLGLRSGKKTARKPGVKPRSKVNLQVHVEKRCIPCEQQELMCDLDKAGAPCGRCVKSGRGGDCRPYQTPEPGTQLKASTRTSSGCSSSPIMIEDELLTKKIWTRFAHPIDFKFIIASNPDRTCDFCANFRYGILGCSLESIEVEVFVKDGKYQELVGGHVASGELPTTMCLRCSIARLAITRCSQHVMAPIKGLAEETCPYQEIMSDLFGGKDLKSETQWCSFCPHPAFHVCGARQQYNRLGQKLEAGDPPVHGCGLRLCSSCVHRLSTFKMNRDRIAADILDGGYRVRADMDFLFLGSDLHKAWSNRRGDYAMA